MRGIGLLGGLVEHAKAGGGGADYGVRAKHGGCTHFGSVD